MTSWFRFAGVALLASALPFATWAQDAATLRLRSLAGSCAGCHGTEGRAVDGGAVPGLAGMPAAYFVEQMTAFKAGTRPATVMAQLARGFSDAQLASLAGYFAALEPLAPRP